MVDTCMLKITCVCVFYNYDDDKDDYVYMRLSHDLFVQSAQWIIMNHLQIDLMTHQLSNVVQMILDHGWPKGAN